MGQTKHQTAAEKDDLETRWNFKARKKDYACSVCGEIPAYVERKIYFATKKCGFHAHTSEKQARRSILHDPAPQAAV